MPAKPMLGDIELQLVQDIEAEDEEALVQHGVPALEGDFLQDLGRRAGRVSLTGVMVGEEVADALKKLRDKFRAAEPVPFVADIATATKVDKVLIEEMGIRDLAGKPERFEYALTLREFIPPPPTRREEPPPPSPPPPPPPVDTGTLIVEVIVEGDPNFDFSKVTVTVNGAKDDGTPLSKTLINRADNVWTEEGMPPGQYTVSAVVTDPSMSGSKPATVRAGQTAQIQIILKPGAVIAKEFIVHFRFDNAFVEPCMREVLDQVARHANDHLDEKLVIVGHTDLVGSPVDLTGPDPYNQSLSERRARSVFAFLTFGRDAAGAMAEWNALRRAQTGLPTLGDKWGTRQYQYMLQDLGFYPGNVDGDHGTGTNDAVRSFRAAKGLPPGTTVDDAVWTALIQDYLGQDNFAVPDGKFLRNCGNEPLKWLGCATQDPVKNTRPPWRPNRRVELLFVKVDKLPCKVPQPDTFNLPAPGAVGSGWCLGPGKDSERACFVVPHLPPGGTPKKDEWVRTPAEPGTFIVRGSIKFEDGTPAANVKYVLIAPDGEFMDGEATSGARRGDGIFGKTKDDGTFEYPDKPKGIGVYTLEIQGQFVARLKGEPIEKAKGNVVCKRLDGSSNFDVIVVAAAVAKVKPSITLASPIVVVKKPHTNPMRQPVTLRVNVPFTGTGMLTRSKNNIRFFTAAVGGAEITFDGTDNVFTDAQLLTSVQLFAEGAQASATMDDVELALALTVNGQAGFTDRVTMTAVEITLDVALSRPTPSAQPPLLSAADKVNVGRFLIVQDATFTHERAMLIIQPPRPSAFSATLELTAVGGHAQAFAQELPAAGQAPLASPHTILTGTIPVGGSQVFAQGTSASGALRDTEFQLGIQGLEPIADLLKITVFPDPSLPGPFAVGEHDYPAGLTFAVPATTETFSEQSRIDIGAPAATVTFGTFPVTLRALVRYPAQFAGVDQPVATALAIYPLVIIAHGNHGVVDAAGNTVESFRGLEYLARHLASYGYIAVSIDLNDMNIPIDRDPAIVQRGLTILDHIRQWGVFNTTDPIFTGRVDLGQIALIGHSRGGEAVVSAHRSNVDDARGFAIRAVVSIAPTDFLGITLPPVPYLVVYGSEDGDVSIGWPFRLYDRAAALKAMVFVYGAIHNRFSTDPDWLALIDSTDARRLSEANHLDLARGYCLGFLDMVMRNVGDHAQLFKRNGRPSTIPAAVELHHQVQDPTRLTVDNFDQGALNRAIPLPPQLATRAGTNSLGGAVTVAGLAVPTGLANARTEASLQHRDIAPFWHDTVGGMVAWDAGGGTYTTAVGDRNVSAFAVLSFRVAQRFDSARNPNPAGATTPGAPQDCTVTLVDSGGRVASVRAGTIALIPFPYKRTTAALTKSALKTIRIPLSAFTDANGNMNLTAIRSIRFECGPAARGELAIDDIEFSN